MSQALVNIPNSAAGAKNLVRAATSGETRYSEHPNIAVRATSVVAFDECARIVGKSVKIPAAMSPARAP
jgi:hypothetical protein